MYELTMLSGKLQYDVTIHIYSTTKGGKLNCFLLFPSVCMSIPVFPFVFLNGIVVHWNIHSDRVNAAWLQVKFFLRAYILAIQEIS